MAGLAMKRMTRERQMLQKENEDYFAFFKDDNLLSFDAYVVGPDDSLYKHKLVKLHFDIPHNYPMVPPKVKFIQYSGGRIHPNLYTEGTVCLSILGTWEGEPWTFSMNCNTILITIRSLLDNKPYLHEPGQRNHPEFNHYVQYCTWRSLLFDHVRHERDESARAFLHKFLTSRAPAMVAELKAQQAANSTRKEFLTPYAMRQPRIVPDYPNSLAELKCLVQGAELHNRQAAASKAAAAAEAAAAATEEEEEGKASMTVATVVSTPATASAPILAAGAAQAPTPAQLSPGGSQRQKTKRAASAATGAEDEDHEAPASKRTRK